MNRPLRILHVVGGMNRGGTETWLMHVLRHIDRKRFQLDFLVHSEQPGAYDDEIRSLGAKVISCLSPAHPWAYARNFKRILREHGPYDIVHSHVHFFTGYALRLAAAAGVPVRIAHSLTDTSTLKAKAGLIRRMYLTLTGRWIARYATEGLAVNEKAAASLFGQEWRRDKRWRVLFCSVDLTLFETQSASVKIRTELGIPANAFVVGHVGRFVEVKNHAFLLDIATEIIKREPNAYLLLVGDGPLRASIEQKVEEAGLRERVRFAGLREDVPRVMLEAMNVFLLPSLLEGFPLVLIEAQAAGLPCVFTDVVSWEADILEALVRRVSLAKAPDIWAEEVLAMRNVLVSRAEALAQVKQTSFNIEVGARELTEFYTQSYLCSTQISHGRRD